MRHLFLLTTFVLLFLVSGVAAQQIINEDGAIVKANERTASSSTTQNQQTNGIRVNFVSNPSNANLFIDNVSRGNTPATLYLSPGTHRARLTKQGYKPVEFNFTIRTGYQYTYTVTFSSTGGSNQNSTVNINSNPSGAGLIVDGINRGTTPETISLRPGTHTAKFFLNGYKNRTVQFSILGGRIYNLNVNLVPTSGGGGNQLAVDLKMAQWYPQGQNAVLICQASGGSGNYEYDFHFGDGMHQYNQENNNVYHVYPMNGTYSASCTVRDENTGASKSDTLNVVIGSGSDGGEDNETDGNETQGDVDLKVAQWFPQGLNVVWICDNAIAGAAEYNYMFGDGQTQTTDREDVYHTYSSAGSYNAECVVRSSGGEELGRSSESVSVSSS